MKIFFIVIPLVVLVVAAAGYFLFFDERTVSQSALEFINLAHNYKFEIPEGYNVNPNANQRTLILMKESVKQYDPTNYKNLIDNKAIIIQPYTKFNKNDEIFENYIRKQYQSNEKLEIELEFEEVNHNKVAVLKADYKKEVNYKEGGSKEYLKIINSYYVYNEISVNEHINR